MKTSQEERLVRALIRLNISRLKLMKAKKERIWIEDNPNINLITYPYYKLKQRLFGK